MNVESILKDASISSSDKSLFAFCKDAVYDNDHDMIAQSIAISHLRRMTANKYKNRGNAWKRNYTAVVRILIKTAEDNMRKLYYDKWWPKLTVRFR